MNKTQNNIHVEQAVEGDVPAARPSFHMLADAIDANYHRLTGGNNVFRVGLPKGQLFDTYLNAIPEEHKQWLQCECCRSFLNRYGSMVVVGAEGKIISALWSDPENGGAEFPAFFAPAVKAMRELVEKTAIRGVFLSEQEVLGDIERGGFNHLYINRRNGVFHHPFKTGAQLASQAEQDYALLSKFLGTTDQKVLDDVLFYFEHDAKLKTATAFISTLQWGVDLKRRRDLAPNQLQRNAIIWEALATQNARADLGKGGKGRVRIGQSVLGNFIETIKSGGSFDKAKGEFLAQTNPVDYMKPVSAPTTGNINQAEEIFKKMELAPSLRRRFATLEDIPASAIKWAPRVVEPEPAEAAPVFGHLKPKQVEAKPAAADMPKIDGGVLTLQRFLDEVMPEADEVHLALNNFVNYNFAGITTAADPEAKPLLLWDDVEARNPVGCYTYDGGSTPAVWGLISSSAYFNVKVTHVIVEPSCWGATHGEEALIFLLEGANDRYMQHIPLSPAMLRRDLHEIRATLHNFFITGKMEPLEEGKQAIAGMFTPTQKNVAVNLTFNVTKDGKVVTYRVDRTA